MQIRNIVILIILSFSHSLAIIAQKNQSLGFKSGFALTNAPQTDSLKRTAVSSAFYGLSYKYQFESNIFIHTGLEYQKRSYIDDPLKDLKAHAPYSNYKGERVKQSYTYFGLPIKMGKHYGGKVFFEPQVGLFVSKLIQEKTNHYYETFGYYVIAGKTKKIDVSGIVESTIGYEITSNFSLSFNLAYQRSLYDFFSAEPFQDSKEFHKGLYLSLSVRKEF